MRKNFHASLPVDECCGGEKEFWIEIKCGCAVKITTECFKVPAGSRQRVLGCAWQSLLALQMPRGGHRSNKSPGHSWLILSQPESVGGGAGCLSVSCCFTLSPVPGRTWRICRDFRSRCHEFIWLKWTFWSAVTITVMSQLSLSRKRVWIWGSDTILFFSWLFSSVWDRGEREGSAMRSMIRVVGDTME